jgi:hypothetical protein
MMFLLLAQKMLLIEIGRFVLVEDARPEPPLPTIVRCVAVRAVSVALIERPGLDGSCPDQNVPRETGAAGRIHAFCRHR